MDERRVVVVGFPGAELLEIASVTTTLGIANGLSRPSTPYSVEVASLGGRPILCSTGLTLQSQARLETLTGPLDTLVVSGAFDYRPAAADDVLVAHVRRLAGESRRVTSICTGASVLAAAGLLDGRRATTHWRFADDIAASRPAVTIDPRPIYIRDGHIATAAGITSALDLTLALVEEDCGADLARQVARDLVVYLQRPANQAQMSVHTAAPPPRSELVRQVVEHAKANLDATLDAAELAQVAGVSPRHLTRRFVAELGDPPARYVRTLRVEAAAHLLVGTRLPLARVADRCGFGSAEALRQAFTAQYGVPPSEYRARQSRSG